MVSFNAQDYPRHADYRIYSNEMDYADYVRIFPRDDSYPATRSIQESGNRKTRQKGATHSHSITDQVKQGASGNRGYPGRGEPLSQKEAPTRLPNSNAKRW